jgi:hypothetical protein
MNEQKFDINKLRVAAPCSAAWETMTGDARARHCESCRLNVYNISEMTKLEAENLIASREGRLCIRLYRRTDGTVLTKDCPVGFRAYQKRVARFAGAALTAILGLFSVSFGQKTDKKEIDASKLNIVRTVSRKNILSGTIIDPNGAVIPGVEISLFKDKIRIGKISSNDEGDFAFLALSSGNYRLEVVKPGFEVYKVKNIKIGGNGTSKLNVSLQLKIPSEVMGIYFEDSSIDMSSSGGTTTITREMMGRIPQ